MFLMSSSDKLWPGAEDADFSILFQRRLKRCFKRFFTTRFQTFREMLMMLFGTSLKSVSVQDAVWVFRVVLGLDKEAFSKAFQQFLL